LAYLSLVTTSAFESFQVQPINALMKET